MKTSSRRRVLISSVAMLLVAMLALGTATFAWFTQNTTATADGVYAKAVKASSLVVSKADKEWATAITDEQGTSGQDNEQKMFPASSGDSKTWYSATSEDAATGAAAAGTVSTVTPEAKNAKYVFKEMLNVKNDGTEGTIEDITITWDLAKCGNSAYARIALVPCDADGKDLTTAAFEGQLVGFTNCVYDTEGEKYNGLKGTNLTTDIQSITAKAAGSVTVADLDAQEAVYYNLYIWFEGQDADCIDDNVGSLISGLEFTVSGTPA